jgi:hypothetical protein
VQVVKPRRTADDEKLTDNVPASTTPDTQVCSPGKPVDSLLFAFRHSTLTDKVNVNIRIDWQAQLNTTRYQRLCRLFVWSSPTCKQPSDVL